MYTVGLILVICCAALNSHITDSCLLPPSSTIKGVKRLIKSNWFIPFGF